VVIGNPPYVRQELLSKNHKEYFKNKFYDVQTGATDLYVIFYQLSLDLLSKNGLLGFITPNKFIRANYGGKLRTYLGKHSIQTIIDFGELSVFHDAATFPCILIVRNCNGITNNSAIYLQVKSLSNIDIQNLVYTESFTLSSNAFQNNDWKLISQNKSSLFEKLANEGIELERILGKEIKYGIKTGFNEAFIIDEKLKNELIHEDPKSEELIKKFIVGDNVRKHRIDYQDNYILLVKNGLDISNYPAIEKHLNKFKKNLEKRYDKGQSWFDLRACDYYDKFDETKIIYPVIAKESRFCLDNSQYFFNDKAFMIPTNNVQLLAILNSKLIWYYLKNVCSVLGDPDSGGRLELRRIYMSKTPIKFWENSNLILKVESLIKGIQENTIQFYDLKKKFLLFCETTFNVFLNSRKLSSWEILEFKEFIDCINKSLKSSKLVHLTKKDEFEWMELFEENKKKALTLKAEIDRTDKEIDQMVYELYGLTEEEIKIVEGEK
jgi:hypothetical protein